MYTTVDHENRFSGRMPESEPEQANDLTLGTAALLGIFFAIVIVCALFFGFGYSIGHRGSKLTALASQSPAVTAPSPAASLTAATPPAGELEETPAGAAPGAAGSGRTKPSASSVEVPTAVQASAQVENAAPAALGQYPAGAPGQFIVQIAAVMHTNDAEALAAALRREGYNAQVRTEPQDHFLHIQIGPFANRDTARSMRARLQADGYSPIVKP